MVVANIHFLSVLTVSIDALVVTELLAAEESRDPVDDWLKEDVKLAVPVPAPIV